MTADPRQLIEFHFGGKLFRVRPTWSLLVAIETSTGQASRTLGLRMLRSECGLVEIARVLEIFCKDQNVPMSIEKIGDELVEKGYGEIIMPLGEFLLRAVKGNQKHEEEAMAAAASGPPAGTGG